MYRQLDGRIAAAIAVAVIAITWYSRREPDVADLIDAIQGNFRPDVATIAAIERVLRAAGVTPPAPGPDVVANQQAWDKKQPDPPKRTKSPPAPKGKNAPDAKQN